MAKLDKYENLVNNVLDLVGGKDNVSSFTHCITRLRFNLKDRGLVNVDQIQSLDGVVGAQWSGEQLQIIIGPNVEKVFDAINKKYHLAEVKAEGDKKSSGKKNPVTAMIEAIAGCLIPLIPLLTSVGMLKVFLMLVSMAGIMDSASSTYQMINLVADAGLYFLPVFVAATAAKKFNATLGLAMLLGAMLIAPNFIANVSAGTAMTIFGIPVTPASYSSQIFPTIMSVFVLSKIEKVFKKFMPSILHSFLTPLLVMMIMIPLTFCAIAPIGTVLSSYITAAIVWINETFGFLGVAIYACLSPIMVLTGMHVGMVPYLMQCMTTIGYDPIVTVAGVISNINRGIVCLAVALKSKMADRKGAALSAGVTAIVGGVTEPALFGIMVPLKSPLYGCLIGSFVGGLVAGLFKVYLIAFPGSMGLFAIPCYSNIPMFLLALAVSAVISFAYTFVFYKDE
ncbi:MAG: PTS transporter subunit EIIC [Tyzzerella sp.]|nr:PTS transporter subunit EIIC [Tyzzerella sp.]